MCMFYCMCGNNKRDKMRNKNIHAKIDVTPIEEKMIEKCLRWFVHMLRRLWIS